MAEFNRQRGPYSGRVPSLLIGRLRPVAPPTLGHVFTATRGGVRERERRLVMCAATVKFCVCGEKNLRVA